MTISRESILVYLLYIPSVLSIFLISFNHLIYIIPIVFLIISLFTEIYNKEHLVEYDIRLFVILFFYVAIVIISSVLNFLHINWFLFYRDTIIIISPLILFINNFKFSDKQVKIIFIVFILIYFQSINFAMPDLSFSSLLIGQQESFSFIAGFIFGAFLLYFLASKNFIFLILSGLMVLVASKRVVFLGLFCAIPYYYFLYRPVSKSQIKLLLQFAYYSILFIVGLTLDKITILILELFGMSSIVNLNTALSSREVFIDVIRTGLLDSNFFTKIFGHGAGQADYYLQNNLNTAFYNVTNPANPHNDFLKIAYDYGLIGFIFFFLFFHALYGRSNKHSMIFFYSVAILLVDNSLIVLFYSILAGIIVRVKHIDK